jgi:hypothetical protein
MQIQKESNVYQSKVAVVVFIAALAGTNAFAKPPSTGGASGSTVSATGTFGDASGDYLQSDGGGSYYDGQQGVSSHIDGAFGDYDLNLNSSSRRMYVGIPTYISGCTLPYHDEQLNGYFALQHAYLENMAIGATESVQFSITLQGSSGSWGLFFWPLQYPGGTNGGTAYRASSTEWIITADPTAIATVVKGGGRGFTTCGTATGVNFSVIVTTP